MVLALGAAVIAPAPAARPVAVQRSEAQRIYAKWCSDCHSVPGRPGSMALERKYHGNPSAILEQRTDLNPDYVKLVVRHGISFMPSFRKTEISDAELALVADYLAHPAAGDAKPGKAKAGGK
ncbi:cytochrome c [Sphingomonas glacialis]|uniref:Cytochrome c n=1 Tax=Sphingomonas glacialis TaxID=658225 RepID=A0A502G1X7_9SPHN|nr:cytochrome c [Sphingomonas glacialis]